MRIFCCFLLFAAPAVADDALITRLGGVSFAVANVERASQFYGDLLGLEKAFDLKDAGGKVQSVFFKVNDDQYLEFSPGESREFSA